MLKQDYFTLLIYLIFIMTLSRSCPFLLETVNKNWLLKGNDLLVLLYLRFYMNKLHFKTKGYREKVVCVCVSGRGNSFYEGLEVRKHEELKKSLMVNKEKGRE